ASGGSSWSLGDDVGAGSYPGLFSIANSSNNAVLYITSSGNVGLGTATPAATLDVNGTMHLKEYSAAPATCSATEDGVIALTTLYTICVCKNGTGWVTASDGMTSCAW
ncbi:MAG: hypothetical protein WCD70_17210, partial [Alphaproteobacteria bacterium]